MNTPIDLLHLHSKSLAEQLIARVLLVGMIWIQFGWIAGVATGVVWLLTARLLTDACYDGMMETLHEHFEEHLKSCEACKSGQGHDAQEQDPEHHDSGHTP